MVAPALAHGAALAPSMAPRALLDDIQARTFRYFWETTDPVTGLAPDRWPHAPFGSIASTGFALTAYPIGVQRGWVARPAAALRVRNTLRFLGQATQGPAVQGVAGYKGLFYHFLDMNMGARFKKVELSTVDTAWLMAGALFCSSYFTGDSPVEVQIRGLAEDLYRGVDWQWASPAATGRGVNMGWDPVDGFLKDTWLGYNEAMMMYILALGSPTHAVEPDAWSAWTQTYDENFGLHGGPLPHLGYPSLFTHQYSHVWIDFRGIRDAYMRNKGFDYFENSRRATLAQQAYAIANPMGWKAYSRDIWGLTACDGPGDSTHLYRGERRQFHGYDARGPGQDDDGTLAPTAALGSIAFAPEICTAAAVAMHRQFGPAIYGRYGFTDAFNPSFDFTDVRPETGKVVPAAGWVAPQYLGIDQGPIVAMIENLRGGLIWNTMRQNPHIQRGLKRAGFTGGWLDRV
jgi:hypothetical protein